MNIIIQIDTKKPKMTKKWKYKKKINEKFQAPNLQKEIIEKRVAEVN
jgi:hypothetical protein